LLALEQNETELEAALRALPPLGQGGDSTDPNYRMAYHGLQHSLLVAISDLHRINNGLEHVASALLKGLQPANN
jgi:hypothetical protein